MNQPAEDRTGGDASDNPGEPVPDLSMSALAGQYAAKAGVRQDESGRIDVLQSIGGMRGLAESILPGLLFTVVFTILRDLQISLIVALAVSAVFTITRLLTKTPLTQALSGLIGVGICAFVANRTGNAEDFFLPGILLNAGSAAAYLLSDDARNVTGTTLYVDSGYHSLGM